MTKRTNAFQKAIFYIHDQLKDSDAIVTESAELNETNVDVIIKREIDVIIEKKVKEKVFRIAIECRDRTNKDDIQWIDCLIGKFKNLPVDRIIAVSKSGFSKNAHKKAETSQIELISLKEISSMDWKTEYEKLGFSSLNMAFKLDKIHFEIDDKCQIKINENDIILFKGEKISIKTLLSWYIEAGFWSQINKEFKNQFLSVYKTKQDLKRQVLLIKKIPFDDAKIILKNVPYTLKSIQIFIIGTPNIIDVNLTYFKYQNSIISSGKLAGTKQNEEMNLYLTQALPENKIQLSYDQKKIKSKTNKCPLTRK
jgi:hypothetical protein